MFEKYFVEAGAIAVRRVKKEDMKRIAKVIGGQVVVTIADLDGNEAFDASNLGECALVSEERVGDGELIYFRGCIQRCTNFMGNVPHEARLVSNASCG